jgi:antitoxin VapB
MSTAKILSNGNKQTILLPDEINFNGDEVYIKRIGNMVILIPKENPWQSLFDSLDQFSEDFMETREQLKLENKDKMFE